MKSIHALLPLLPLVLLSSAAGPCTDQKLGNLDDNEDAGADAAGAGSDAAPGGPDAGAGLPDATPGASATACMIDDDCVNADYLKPVASQADCYCTTCEGPANASSAQTYAAEWHQFCEAWAVSQKCEALPCVPPSPVGCEAHQCVSLEPALITGTQACDPLAARPQPITLGSVLAVGKHADGTLYVIGERGTSDYLVFMSAGATLQRQRQSGSGEVNQDGLMVYILSAGAGAEQFTLQLEVRGSEKRMGILRGTFAGKGFVIGQQGEVLEVVGTDALAGLAVKNLPGTIVTEYQAQLADGRRILVTRPEDDGSYSDFRLYLGPANQVAERRVSDVQRARSGTTTIAFLLDFQATSIHFGSTLAPGDQPWAMINGVMQPLTVLAPTTPTAGLSFLCRAP
jgi:hypothetical protein